MLDDLVEHGGRQLRELVTEAGWESDAAAKDLRVIREQEAQLLGVLTFVRHEVEALYRRFEQRNPGDV